METTSRSARTNGEEFIEASCVFLQRDFLPKLTHCLEQMPEADIWWRPNEQSNSVGNLVLHLCGNVRQWIVASLGGGSFARDRDAEFSTRTPVSKEQLTEAVQLAVADAVNVLKRFPEERLLGHQRIQGYDASGLQAVYHVVEHFSYHLGQILYIYKLRTGVDPGFYRHLNP